jgi:hypothetical protein
MYETDCYISYINSLGTYNPIENLTKQLGSNLEKYYNGTSTITPTQYWEYYNQSLKNLFQHTSKYSSDPLLNNKINDYVTCITSKYTQTTSPTTTSLKSKYNKLYDILVIAIIILLPSFFSPFIIKNKTLQLEFIMLCLSGIITYTVIKSRNTDNEVETNNVHNIVINIILFLIICYCLYIPFIKDLNDGQTLATLSIPILLVSLILLFYKKDNYYIVQILIAAFVILVILSVDMYTQANFRTLLYLYFILVALLLITFILNYIYNILSMVIIFILLIVYITYAQTNYLSLIKLKKNKPYI